ncbi:hypothetical protein AVEN_155010-1 [Araneus ventricosus]|uniref:Uncharacterized protein n=1 Tax=Araneus ventricosus TaxID=182803 RepID=A0A4Y2A7G2_ARAVE|nr:hypothetical protein AVEN_155010-1 [Araneus ventricosus]
MKHSHYHIKKHHKHTRSILKGLIHLPFPTSNNDIPATIAHRPKSLVETFNSSLTHPHLSSYSFKPKTMVRMKERDKNLRYQMPDSASFQINQHPSSPRARFCRRQPTSQQQVGCRNS